MSPLNACSGKGIQKSGLLCSRGTDGSYLSSGRCALLIKGLEVGAKRGHNRVQFWFAFN